MKVSTILTTKRPGVITIRPFQTLKEAAQLLNRHRIGALIVLDDHEQPVGILSERDIVRIASESDGVLACPVADAMTASLITGVPDDDLLSVAHTMTERHIRHLPILANGRLVGIVSIGDVLKAQRNQYRGERNTLETQILAEDSD